MTEIKPIVNKDPLRRAYEHVVTVLLIRLESSQWPVTQPKTGAGHLQWMCREILRDINTMQLDKMGRWVGFIQGVMCANGVLDVDQERDRTRPIFERANEINTGEKETQS